MSTPELLGADEARVVGRVGDLPGVDDESNEADEVTNRGNGVEPLQLLFGGRTLRGFAQIFNAMHGFDLRRKHIGAQQAKRQDADEQPERKTAERFSRVDDFRKEVDESDAAADEIHGEITPDEMLSNDAGVVGAKHAFHFLAENARSDGQDKKDRGSQPDGRVKNSNDAQNEQHVRKAIGRRRASQALCHELCDNGKACREQIRFASDGLMWLTAPHKQRNLE